MDAPKSGFHGRRHDSKRERMMVVYLLDPSGWLGRWRQRRAESWLVHDSLGLAASSLYDTRPQEAEMRERWRRWRAEQLGR
jgi:hypothetical protein